MSASDDFCKSASLGEKVIECEIGHRSIVMGQAYPIDNGLKEPDAAGGPASLPGAAQASAIEEEIVRACEARRRTLGTYARRRERFNHLPIEARMEAEEMQDAEQLTLDDEEFFNREIIEKRVKKGLSAERAVWEAYKPTIDKLAKSPVQKMRGMSEMLSQIASVYLQHLAPQGRPASIEDAPPKCIPVMENLPAGILPYFYEDAAVEPKIFGAVTRKGTPMDHGWIVARSSGITIAQPKENINIKAGDVIIIDGPGGKIILNPAEATIEDYRRRSGQLHNQQHALLSKSQENILAELRNGEKVKVCANIGFSNEIRKARHVGAAGIGLYRTELPFIQSDKLPSREGWRRIFEKIVDEADKMHVTLRVVDFDGDKRDPGKERFSTETVNQTIRDQITAALLIKKAKPDAKMSLMIPTVSTREYFYGMKDHFEKQATEILGADQETWPYFGSMVENYAVTTKLKDLGADFLSVGSNDLIANALGYGRYRKEHSDEYDPTDSAIIWLFEKTLQHDSDTTPVSICGDAASDPRYISLLIGTGFRQLSSGVNMVPTVKGIVRRIDPAEAKAMVEKLKTVQGKDNRHAILDAYNRSIGINPDNSLDENWMPPGTAVPPQPAPPES